MNAIQEKQIENCWTDEEIQFLKDNFKDYKAEKCAEHLGHTACACEKKAQLLGLTTKINVTKRTPWTKDDIQFLKDNYREHGSQYCAENLHRSLQSCKSEARNLHLLEREWSEEEDKFLAENFLTKGADYCAEHLSKRTRKACVARATIKGITTNGWTKEQEDFLKENYPTHKMNYCAERLGKSPATCYAKAKNLGISKNHNWRTKDVKNS